MTRSTTSRHPSHIWFTADLHLGHEKILRPDFSDRPWGSIEEHDNALVRRWNEVVEPDHEVWFLGDLGWINTRHRERLVRLVSELQGHIRWVAGNHDYPSDMPQPILDWMGPMVDRTGLNVETLRDEEGCPLYLHLDHFPLREWDRMHAGSLHLFGHVHGRHDRSLLPRTLDVGVDSMRYRPVSLTQVLQIMGIDSEFKLVPPKGLAKEPLEWGTIDVRGRHSLAKPSHH